MSHEDVIPKPVETAATCLGDGVYALFSSNYNYIRLLAEDGTVSIALQPQTLIALMKFARLCMGEDVFREIDRLAGGGQ